MLRFEVGDLPAIDCDDAVVVIGSAATARIRLPANVARGEHVRLEAGAWRALHALDEGGAASGEIGAGCVLAIGGVRVRVSPAPAGAVPTPAVRTESLARELVRDLLGEQAAPRLEVLRGPLVGATRQLAPPESVLVIGRGDEATWVILDGDLSRAHAEVRRGWDGVRVFDRGSTNGTRVGGVRVGDAGAPLADGDVVELGNVSMRFHDPAERHLRAEPSASTSLPVAALFPSIIEPRPSPPLQQLPPPRASASPARVSAAPPSQLVFYAALVIAALAAAALVYLLAA